LAGRVTVDGRPARLGESVDTESQDVRVDGRRLSPQTLEYWLLNKPAGVVTTVRDPEGRPTVVDCLATKARVFPVGRLDLETTGVLLLTNDGELAHRLLHPRYGVEKEYVATVLGRPDEATLEVLRHGVELEDGPTAPARVELVGPAGRQTQVSLVIHEGRKRQVRRMLQAVGHPVRALHRRRFGPLDDARLPPGKARRLRAEEISRLKEVAGPA
jgi:23S rRNA pseudouridine2605 synthase